MRTHAFLIGCLAGFSTASSYALDYPLSPRMGATVIKIDNIDSSKASAIGQVMRPDAEEYCNRDPNGDRRAAGSQQKCVNELLKDLGGRQYFATANCTQKKVTTRNETYVVKKTIKGPESDGNDFLWANARTGEILGSSNADGTPTIERIFLMLCPKFR